MRIDPKIAIAVLALGLAGCGANPVDRAITGAGIGAGAGALVDEPLAGAAIGGAAGVLTSPEQIDLGRPPWRR